MKEQHFVKVKYWQAWHARARALEVVHGSYEELYKLLPQLCTQLLEANPGSIIKWSMDDVSKKWTSTCISFRACLDGFVQGCRLLVGLDGCHLKGKYGGVCLVMTSLDGNNGMFPIGIYLCQAENKENWMKFMELMKDELNKHPLRLMIMSDRQKGLDLAVDEVFPSARKRYCFKHIFQNMKEYHRGELVEEMSWNAARAYTEVKFKKWMERLDSTPSKNKKKKPTEGECEGENESTNFQRKKNAKDKTAVEYQVTEEDKPLHKLVINYTLMMMSLMFKKKEDAIKLSGDGAILPRVQKVIDGHTEWIRHYLVTGSDTHHTCVQNNNGKWWNVDLILHTCDCKKWNISGIPCVHAVAFIARFSETRVIDWPSYCSRLLNVKNYRAAYASGIRPPLHESNWDVVPSDLLPPLLHRRPGRPRTKRRRGEFEGAAQTPTNQRQCSTCGIFGHNKSSCQGGLTRAQEQANLSA